MKKMELKDKVVIVTGSSQGIGAETAKQFAKEGAKVVITYSSNEEKAKEVLNHCQGGMIHHLDIVSDESIKYLIDDVMKEFGRIDVLVNNAGIVVIKNFVNHTFEDIKNLCDINLAGLMKLTLYAVNFIQKSNEGMIINVSSGAGKVAYAGLSAYSATKFGVRGFTQAISKELPSNIRAYSVNPGMTQTQMTGFRGDPVDKVAKVILDVATGNISIENGGDVDLSDY